MRTLCEQNVGCTTYAGLHWTSLDYLVSLWRKCGRGARSVGRI